MRLFPKDLFIQNLSATFLRENFLISAVGTIFAIRVFLKLTGYPSIGGSELHFAHLLWGGLFMLVALMMFLSFLSKSSTQVASILAGIGFGAFIDELGKFITRDNDYFFQPTAAIIYALFVGIFMVSRLLERQKATQKEYLINALDMVKEAVINDLDEEEKALALTYLRRANQKDPLVIELQEFIHKVELIPQPSPSLFIRIRHFITSYYFRLSRSPLLVRSLSVLVILQTAFVIVATIVGPRDIWHLTFSEYGRLFSSILATIFILLATISFFMISRVQAYKFLKSAILTQILLVQFFQFYDDAVAAIIGVVFNGLLLLVVDYILEKEKIIPSKSS